MYGDPGDFFFHYTTRKAAFEHILPKRRLRLSPYAKMRDPMEAHAPTLGAGLFVPDDPAVDQAMQLAWLNAWTLVAGARNRTKLLSLTVDAEGYEGPEETFGRGWARARMWEQYSENHAGVCLLFHRARFRELVLSQLQARAPGACCGPVRYTRQGFSGEAARTMILDPDKTGKQLAAEHMQKHRESLFFLKLTDWESEHEFRFIEPSEDDEYSCVDIEDTLAAVMVGANFPDWQIPSAHAICTEAKADVRKVVWEHMNRPLPIRLVQAPRIAQGRFVTPGEPPPGSRSVDPDLTTD